MVEVPVQIGRKLTVPDPVTPLAGAFASVPAAPATPEDAAGAASTKAVGGSPPMVCASPAFSAYGTLSNKTRGCSAWFCGWTPNQRASPEANRPVGKPWLLVEPSITV